MPQKEIDHFFKEDKFSIKLAIGALILGALLIILSFIMKSNIKLESMIDIGKDNLQAGQYVSTKVNQYQPIGKMDNGYYYLILTELDERFIVKLTKEDASNIFNLKEVKGFLSSFDSEEKEAFEKKFLKDYNEELYIDGVSQSPVRVVLARVFGSIFIIIGIITYLVDSSRKKNLQNLKEKYDFDELKKLMASEETKYYKDINLVVTNKHIIGLYSGLHIYNIKDVNWLYTTYKVINHVLMHYLKAGINDKVVYLGNASYNSDQFIEAINHIKTKKHNILVGYNEENKSKFKNLNKKA